MSPSLALAWCQACSVAATQASCRSVCDACDGEGQVQLSWRKSCYEYAVHEAGSRDIADDELRRAIQRSADAWTSQACPGRPEGIGFSIREAAQRSQCNQAQLVVDEGNHNTVAFVDDWNDRGYDPEAFAVTVTWFRTGNGEILDVDMLVNQSNFEFGICPPDGCTDGTADLENTLTHEFGHALGLAHSDASQDATMWACADSGEVLKRDLEADDERGLCELYPDGSLGEVCEPEPVGGFSPQCQEPGCGCAAPGRTGRFPWPIALALGAFVFWRRRRR